VDVLGRKISAVDTTLSGQVQDPLDVLALAPAQAAQVVKTMKKQGIDFGAGGSQIEDEITRIISKIRYVKRLAEHKEHIDAVTERTTAPD
jgi:hypothetical protein